MTIGDRLRTQRRKRGLTQARLAELAQVRRPTITELETNVRVEVTASILRRLAKALGCTTDYLVGMYEDEDSELTAAVAS